MDGVVPDGVGAVCWIPFRAFGIVNVRAEYGDLASPIAGDAGCGCQYRNLERYISGWYDGLQVLHPALAAVVMSGFGRVSPAGGWTEWMLLIANPAAHRRSSICRKSP
jgi:hypothetical protein